MFGYKEESKSRYILLDGEFGNHYLGAGFSKNKYTNKQLKNASYLGYTLIFILRGKAILTDEDTKKTYYLQAGSFFQRLPNKKYSLKINNYSDLYTFYLTIPENLYKIIEITNGLNCNLVVKRINIDSKFMGKLENYLNLFEEINEDSAFKILPETCSLITSCFNTPKSQIVSSKFFFSTGQHFEKNCHIRLDLESYARANGYSYESFRKKFRCYFGISPYRYLINCRMDQAVLLLTNLDYSVKDIAIQLGYTTSYEFSKHFKKYFNKTPSQFRKDSF